jgi:hypothetical protein
VWSGESLEKHVASVFRIEEEAKEETNMKQVASRNYKFLKAVGDYRKTCQNCKQ